MKNLVQAALAAALLAALAGCAGYDQGEADDNGQGYHNSSPVGSAFGGDGGGFGQSGFGDGDGDGD